MTFRSCSKCSTVRIYRPFVLSRAFIPSNTMFMVQNYSIKMLLVWIAKMGAWLYGLVETVPRARDNYDTWNIAKIATFHNREPTETSTHKYYRTCKRPLTCNKRMSHVVTCVLKLTPAMHTTNVPFTSFLFVFLQLSILLFIVLSYILTEKDRPSGQNELAPVRILLSFRF